MRLFVAVNFGENVINCVKAAERALKGAGSSGVFTPGENVHLTLAFLGECGGERLGDIRSAMEAAAGHSFILKLSEAGVFRRPGGDILWLGTEECPELTSLAARLSEELRIRGFALEERKFVPHLTVARHVKIPGGFSPDALPKYRAEQPVESMELMKSDRVDGRLIYTPLFSVKLV